MNFSKIAIRRIILGFMVFFFCLLSACQNGDILSITLGSSTGDLSFSVNYHGIGNSRVQAAVIDCAGEGISTVEAAAYSLEGELLVRGGPWECDTGQGTISSVPAGSGRVIVILGKNDEENIIFRGQQSGIQVNADQEKNVGIIECFNFTPNLLTPADGSIVNAGTMGLSWSNVTEATEYYVIVSTNSELIDPIIEVDTTTENYTPTGLSDATTYYWQVVAGDAYDNTGMESQIWSFTVDEHHQNTAPVAQITSPADGRVFSTEDTITFSGSGSDNEDGNLIDKFLVWRSDVDGMIGTGETFTLVTLSEGNHQITLTATDSEGETGMDSASIAVTALENTPPVAQITCPAESITYVDGDAIVFAGSGSDSKDGDLSGSSLVWKSDVDGQIGMGKTFILETLSPGAHQITLTATDSDWAMATDSVAITFNAGPATSSIPDTGQILSFTDIFGEDSDYTINPPHYTKLDSSGNDLHACATIWAMVRDEVTGLIWEVKTDDGSIHNKDTKYIWQNVQNDFIAKLNSDNFGGYNDWRLPTIKELYSIVCPAKDQVSPAINTAYFPNTGGDNYWSSNPAVYLTNKAWCVWFNIGQISDYFNSSYEDRKNVRAVRGRQCDNSLVDNGNGTVTDENSGLMWQQSNAGSMTWAEALNYCENLTLAGHGDWRLPNSKELQSIVDYEKHDPSIDSTLFPGTVSDRYWSATTHFLNSPGQTGPGYAYWVSFLNGKVNVFEKSNSLNVRAVRGGQ